MLFFDTTGKGYIGRATLTRTKDTAGNISISGTIFEGDDVLQNIGYGWSFKFQDEIYVVSYTKLNDKDNTIDFDAVHKFLWDFSKSCFYETWNGSHTFEVYLSALFNGSGYTYDLQTTVAAFEKENWGMKNKLDLLSDIIDQAGVEIEISGTKVTIKQQIGADLTSIARYGVNLSDLVEENDISNFATHGKGFGAYNDENDTSKGRLEVEYTSDLAKTYGTLDVDPVVDERYSIANNLLAAVKQKVDATFAVSLSLNMYDLENAGYPNYDSPEVGDWILAIDEKLNFNRKVRIIKLEEQFDANEKRIGYTVTAGDLSQAEQLQSTQAGTAAAIQQLQNDVLNVYYSANGKNRTFTGTDDPNTLTLSGLIAGDMYWRTNGDKKELWIYDGTRWNQEVSDATGEDIKTSVDNAISQAQDADAKALEAVSTAQAASDKIEQQADMISDLSSQVDTATTNSVNAITQAQNAAVTATNSATVANAVKQQVDTLTDGSTMTVAEIESGLALKLTKDDLDGYATEDWTSNQITTTASGLQEQITSVKKTADTATTNVTTLTTDVNGLQTSVASVQTTANQTKTDVTTLQQQASGFQTSINSLQQTKADQTWTTNQINASSDSLKVTIASLQGQVNDSAVGINLYIDTRDFNNPNNNTWTAYDIWQKATDTYNGFTVMQTTNPWNGLGQYIAVKKGETYTFSAYVRYPTGTGTSCMYVSLNTDPENGHTAAGVNTGALAFSPTSDWKRFSFTFNITSDGYIKARVERTNVDAPTIQVCGLKLEKGSHATEWCLSPSEQATVSSVLAVNATVDALTTTVSKKVDNDTFTSYQTQTATALASKVANSDFTSFQSQTANQFNSKVSTTEWAISAMGPNLLDNTKTGLMVTGNNTSNQINTALGWLLTNNMTVHDLYINNGATYTLSFDWQAYANAAGTISGTFIVQWNSVPWGIVPSTTISASNKSGHITKTFTISDSTSNTANRIIMRLDNVIGSVLLTHVKLEKGSIATNYSGSVSEIANSSDIQQLSDSINLRVQKNDVINQINISTEGILIDGKRTHITGQTVIDNAVIKNAMIDTMSASKLTAGTIDASVINVIKLNVNNLVGNTSQFVQTQWNSISSVVSIDASGVHVGAGQGMLNLKSDGMHITDNNNGEDVGLIHKNNMVGDTYTNGLLFDLNKQGDYMGWGYRSDDTSNYMLGLSYFPRESYKGNAKGFNFFDDVSVDSAKTVYLRKIGTKGYDDTQYVSFGVATDLIAFDSGLEISYANPNPTNTGFILSAHQVTLLIDNTVYDLTKLVKALSGLGNVAIPTNINSDGTVSNWYNTEI